MRILSWAGRVMSRVFVTGTIRTVALLSHVIDALIAVVSRSSDRLDTKLAALARASNARRNREGRRTVDPVTLR